MEKSMENPQSQQAATGSPSINPQGEAIPASCLTMSQRLAAWKFMRQTTQKNCLVVSPQELSERLTESEIVALRYLD